MTLRNERKPAFLRLVVDMPLPSQAAVSGGSKLSAPGTSVDPGNERASQRRLYERCSHGHAHDNR